MYACGHDLLEISIGAGPREGLANDEAIQELRTLPDTQVAGLIQQSFVSALLLIELPDLLFHLRHGRVDLARLAPIAECNEDQRSRDAEDSDQRCAPSKIDGACVLKWARGEIDVEAH